MGVFYYQQKNIKTNSLLPESLLFTMKNITFTKNSDERNHKASFERKHPNGRTNVKGSSHFTPVLIFVNK